MSMNEVGYKKPPKHAQFQPGKSGNPNGRPKGAKSPTGHEVFDQLVTVNQKGKPKKIKAIDALLSQLLIDAMKGDHKARKLVLDTWAKGSNKAKSPSLAALSGLSVALRAQCRRRGKHRQAQSPEGRQMTDAPSSVFDVAYEVITKVAGSGPAVLMHASTLPPEARGTFLVQAAQHFLSLRDEVGPVRPVARRHPDVR